MIIRNEPVGLPVGLADHASGRGRDLLLVPGDALVHVQVQVLLDDVPDHSVLAIYEKRSKCSNQANRNRLETATRTTSSAGMGSNLDTAVSPVVKCIF